MTICNDRWIFQKCTPPRFVIERVVEQPQPANAGPYMVPQPEQQFTYMNELQLAQLVQQYHLSEHASFADALGVRSFRPLTDEERAQFTPMIEPFVDHQVKHLMRPSQPGNEFSSRVQTPIISFGLSSFGYDVRVGRNFRVFTNTHSTVVDPKNFNPKNFVAFDDVDFCIIPPNSFALAETVEYFRIPRTVLTICLGKSTYARCGIVVNVTPFEPEWEGTVTLEFSNTTPLPAKIYAGEGCAQVVFLENEEGCEVSYADRRGKYQKQRGVTLPKA